MPFVSRDEDSEINGLFANEQPGFAEEFLPDDDPGVMTFSESFPPPPGPDPLAEAQRANTRLDAGIEAAAQSAARPPPARAVGTDPVTQDQFNVLQTQVDALQAAVTAMLQAQNA